MTAQAGDTFFRASDGACGAPLSKPALRRLCRAKRIAATRLFQRFERRAAARFFDLRALARARTVAVYLASGSEFPTTGLIRALRRRRRAVFVPQVTSATGMRFRKLRSAPKALPRTTAALGSCCRSSQIDVVVMPLLAFDANGTRLGQGGGFYDRSLARHAALNRPIKVGYAWSGQEWPRLPRDAWDVPLQIAITELRARFLRTDSNL